jgi:hypothetical protein
MKLQNSFHVHLGPSPKVWIAKEINDGFRIVCDSAQQLQRAFNTQVQSMA